MAAVRIYTTTYCGYCRSALALLRLKGVEFEQVDVSGDRPMRLWLRERTGSRTVPQIFIHDTAIGGSDELHELEENGELDQLLARRVNG